jgi:predicted O-methyltransferase YrrM
VPNELNIPGWFDFPDYYREVAQRLPQSSYLAEVGVWMGASIIFLALELRKLNKIGSIYAIDTWEGTKGEQDELVEELGGRNQAYNEFLRYCTLHQIEASELRGSQIKLIPLFESSFEAACNFASYCLDFVFIDAGHSFTEVLSDLKAWWPKITRKGFLAGHDYLSSSGVKQAVTQFSRDNNLSFQVKGTCWEIQKF